MKIRYIAEDLDTGEFYPLFKEDEEAILCNEPTDKIEEKDYLNFI